MMNNKPAYDPTQEVRLAVVMYGGVSLAIYINGVAQEMLRLVRATASDGHGCLLFADGELRSTEGVYRRLGQIAGRLEEEKEQPLDDASPIRTRFVIDVISGTSAGGINGIFLGKALANGQRLDELKQLWIDEGDIQVLINDKKSVDPPLELQNPPQSLLNSQRMYAKLLRAFSGMDANGGAESPYVDELDVFATTTDIEGVLVPLRLADGMVFERRYRNVFHFQYAEKELTGQASAANDFEKDNNPFLAFAARCTSSFPFAFEPMSLCDIDAVLDVTPEYAQKPYCRSGSERWQKFFETYLRPVDAPSVPFPNRSFGDGGYLDNKPFSYAIDSLVKRQAGVPVDRKLIYVEPAPDHPEAATLKRSKPDAIANSLAALVEIPGYETIRGDLQRVLEHNREVARVKRIIGQIETDREEAKRRASGGAERRTELRPGEWATLDTADMLARWDDCYVAYNRLKVSSVTDDLVSIFASLFQFDEDSAMFQAMRCLLRAWRDENYVQYHAHPKPTQNQFLIDFDVSYRLRRIRFVLNKADELYRIEDKAARDMLRFRNQDAWLTGDPDAVAGRKAQFRDELTALKRNLLVMYRRLRALERQLWPARRAESPLIAFVEDLDITMEDLHGFLGATPARAAAGQDEECTCKPPAERPVPEEECTERAREFLNQNPGKKQQLDRIATKLREFLVERWLASNVSEELKRLRQEDPSPAVMAARTTIKHYFDHYEDYDLVLFPILFQTNVLGEGAAVELIRISPEDATCLMDDRAEAEKPTPLRKLAGITLGHFGGFVEREWRKNDMMWGRLDAAERLITAILPDPGDQDARLALIDKAQRLIIREELSDGQRFALYNQIAASGADPAALAFARRILLDEKQALKDYREKLDREPNPKAAVRALARATQVVGKMLEGIARPRNIETKRIALITRLGRAFWGLVEVAVPHSLPQLLFHYWLRLIYAFAVALIVAGLLTPSSEAQRVGWTILGATAAVNLAAALLTDYMRRSTSILKALKGILIFLFAAFAAIGIFAAFRFSSEAWTWVKALHLPPATRTRNEEVVMALGGLAALLTLCGLWMQTHAKTLDFVAARAKTESGLRTPILAMEVPESSLDVRAVVGDLHNPDRETMAEIQKADFWFIGLYWLLFAGLSWLMYHNEPGLLLVAIAAFVCSTVAAAFDVVEDLRILQIMKQPLPVKPAPGDALQPVVDSLRKAALAKWAFVFAALLLLTPLFFALGGWLVLPGAWFAAAALVGLVGLWKRKGIELGAAMMGLGLVVLAVLLLTKPDWFLGV